MKFDYTNISYKITINNDKCWVQCATKEFLENKCKELKIVYDDIFQIICYLCYLENVILHETFSIMHLVSQSNNNFLCEFLKIILGLSFFKYTALSLVANDFS